jgi:ABC-type branched-subunit amino acid transport system ATPase component
MERFIMSNEIILEAKNLRKVFGGLVAVDDVSVKELEKRLFSTF